LPEKFFISRNMLTIRLWTKRKIMLGAVQRWVIKSFGVLDNADPLQRGSADKAPLIRLLRPKDLPLRVLSAPSPHPVFFENIVRQFSLVLSDHLIHSTHTSLIASEGQSVHHERMLVECSSASKPTGDNQLSSCRLLLNFSEI
jgi:hypothetical protein